MKDFRLKIKFQNNLLWSKLKEVFGEEFSIKNAAEEISIGYGILIGYLNLRFSPVCNFKTIPRVWDKKYNELPCCQYDKDFKWKPTVVKLAKFFKCLPEELFSELQLKPKEKTNYAIELEGTEMLSLYSPEVLALESKSNPLEEYAKEEEATIIRNLLKTLKPREEKVLRMRFGIGERADHSLEEIGQEFDVGKERIRQIEVKALRKLRSPSRSKYLESYVDI